jgi:uncharacterized protein (DUF2236 family)
MAGPGNRTFDNDMTADDGLFGPGSVTWRIMGEPIVWVAGFRALYLQALHPRTMRGTWQNTAFADPKQAWGRFARTTAFVRVRTFGTTVEVARAGRRIRKIHASLTGLDTDGTRFPIDEPEQLLWVHCGEIASYVDIARRSGMPLCRHDLDRFVDEQRKSAAIIGLDPADVPASVGELDAYYDVMRPKLYACPEAKKALRLSFNPAVPRLLLPLKLVAPPFNTLAFATLPRWARQMYGAPGSPLTDMATTATLRVLYGATRGLPEQVRYTPQARHARQRIREYERQQSARLRAVTRQAHG